MTAESNVYIYAICDPDTDEVRYIGRTITHPEVRLYSHRFDDNAPEKRAWLDSLAARGVLPTVRVLEMTTRALAPEKERAYILQYLSAGANLLNVKHVPGRSGAGVRTAADRRGRVS